MKHHIIETHTMTIMHTSKEVQYIVNSNKNFKMTNSS